VDYAGTGLVPLAEREARLVALEAFPLGFRQVDALRILVPATPASGVVVGRNPRYRRPPRSKCAL
jgi:hypothetical protein